MNNPSRLVTINRALSFTICILEFQKDFLLGIQKAFLKAIGSCKRLLTAEKGSKIRQNTLPSALSRRRHGFDSRWDYQAKFNPLIFLNRIKGFFVEF